jgi:hypothetical protein
MTIKVQVNEVAADDLRLRITSKYIETPRDKQLAWHLKALIQNAKDSLKGGGTRRRYLFLMGESGTGKSKSLEHAFAKVPEFQPYEAEDGEIITPMVSLELGSRCTQKDMAIEILSAFGVHAKTRANERELFDIVKVQLRERRILFLHFDESQHLIRAQTPTSVRALQDRLKSLVSSPDWPVHVILSGVTELSQLLAGDQQLANRSEVMRFESLTYPADSEIINMLIENVSAASGLPLNGQLLAGDFAGRLCAAGLGCFGTIIETIQGACIYAVNNGRSELTAKEFERVYSRTSGCRAEENLFTASRWQEISRANALSDLAPSTAQKKGKGR